MTALNSERQKQLADFVARNPMGVLASLGPDGTPQAALMNIAVTPKLEIVFETTCATRKFSNLERDPRVALVIGWDGQETLQYEGMAERPDGRRRELARDTFIAAFPAKAGDAHWPGNSYWIISPRWLRFSSYYRPRFIEEYTLAEKQPPQRGWWLRLRNFLRPQAPA